MEITIITWVLSDAFLTHFWGVILTDQFLQCTALTSSSFTSCSTADSKSCGGTSISFAVPVDCSPVFLLFTGMSCLIISRRFFVVVHQGKIEGSSVLHILSPLSKWAPQIRVRSECIFKFEFLISLTYSVRIFWLFGIVWNFEPGEFLQLFEQCGTQQLWFTMFSMVAERASLKTVQHALRTALDTSSPRNSEWPNRKPRWGTLWERCGCHFANRLCKKQDFYFVRAWIKGIWERICICFGCPLKSLIADQIAEMQSLNCTANEFTSESLSEIIANTPQFVYCSAEQALDKRFLDALKDERTGLHQKVEAAVVDEAHTVESWTGQRYSMRSDAICRMSKL